ncbi:MAG: N-acetylmuramoyl-L-alanine amidase [Firmicutes bacterium]|nr:N-acetylmuramoyl-L-alanine amidase [Bacillota bacterium]
MRIVLDAGHGGYDSGAVGPGGVKEKDVTLAVVKLLSGLLGSAGGVELMLTRSSDDVPWPSDEVQDLDARVKLANDWGADFYMAVHCNSAADPSAHGVETYCYQFGGQGEIVARAIQAAMMEATGLTDRGVKAGNFKVLRDTRMPAALVEMAFISNPGEERLLNTADFQGRAARAIYDGLAKVFGFVPQDDGGVRIVVGSRVLAGIIINDSAYAPVRALAEALGRTVQWDAATRTVTIT